MIRKLTKVVLIVFGLFAVPSTAFFFLDALFSKDLFKANDLLWGIIPYANVWTTIFLLAWFLVSLFSLLFNFEKLPKRFNLLLIIGLILLIINQLTGLNTKLHLVQLSKMLLPLIFFVAQILLIVFSGTLIKRGIKKVKAWDTHQFTYLSELNNSSRIGWETGCPALKLRST